MRLCDLFVTRAREIFQSHSVRTSAEKMSTLKLNTTSSPQIVPACKELSKISLIQQPNSAHLEWGISSGSALFAKKNYNLLPLDISMNHLKFIVSD